MIQTLLSNFWWIFLLGIGIGLFLYKKLSNNPDAGTSKYKAKKILHLDLETSGILIMKALEQAKFSNVHINDEGTEIQATSAFSMSSWSENIKVTIRKDENVTKMKFISICVFPMQIFDWGKNKENYRKFANELNKLISVSS
ncbi:hypothetical protein [Flavobacterium sp. SM2513]|uniref:hypothetical protein n=1 Tax=Flavobacterium sp. SM2513 TaxID=3424766 RepID=UPI003D7FCF34